MMRIREYIYLTVWMGSNMMTMMTILSRYIRFYIHHTKHTRTAQNQFHNIEMYTQHATQYNILEVELHQRDIIF